MVEPARTATLLIQSAPAHVTERIRTTRASSSTSKAMTPFSALGIARRPGRMSSRLVPRWGFSPECARIRIEPGDLVGDGLGRREFEERGCDTGDVSIHERMTGHPIPHRRGALTSHVRESARSLPARAPRTLRPVPRPDGGLRRPWRPASPCARPLRHEASGCPPRTTALTDANSPRFTFSLAKAWCASMKETADLTVMERRYHAVIPQSIFGTWDRGPFRTRTR